MNETYYYNLCLLLLLFIVLLKAIATFFLGGFWVISKEKCQMAKRERKDFMIKPDARQMKMGHVQKNSQQLLELQDKN